MAFARNMWRTLTSMGTALVLLFLLALAAIPGALLPQRSLNEGKVEQYIAEHPAIGPWLDRLQAFEVFSSFWFTAIYVLLFVSLVGCLTPRLFEHVRSLRAKPVAAPRNLGRLPKHHTAEVAGEPDAVAATVSERLTGWRRVTRKEGDAVEISAEKGYLREFGNIVFHFALLGLLVAVAVGKLFGYEGNVIVIADGGPGFCSASPAAFDSFRAGNTVDGTSLNPICLRVNDFDAHYLPSGQALSFAANIDYQAGADLNTDTWRRYHLKVNEPLRIGGDRVYLQGHGYAPTFTVTFPDGQIRTQTVQWRPDDPVTLLSSGVMRFDPPGGTYPNADERRKHQIAIQGLFAPTEQLHGTLLSSSFPALNDSRRGGGRLPRRHRAGHRAAAVVVLARPAADRAEAADQGGAGEPARRAGDPSGRRHAGAVRRCGAVHQRAGLPRPGPGVGLGVRPDDDGRPAGLADRAAAPGLGSDRGRYGGYGKRRAGRTGPHRQLRLGRRVRAVDATAAVWIRRRRGARAGGREGMT